MLVANKDQQSGLQLPRALTSSAPEHNFQLSVALAQSNDRMSEVKNDSFYRLGLLERPPWSVLPLEAMLFSVDQATAGPWRACWCPLSMLLPKAELMPMGHVDICGLFCHCRSVFERR